MSKFVSRGPNANNKLISNGSGSNANRVQTSPSKESNKMEIEECDISKLSHEQLSSIIEKQRNMLTIQRGQIDELQQTLLHDTPMLEDPDKDGLKVNEPNKEEEEEEEDPPENPILDRKAFDAYRLAHPGPESTKAFNFWVRNGGADRADFKWNSNKKGRAGKSVRDGKQGGGKRGKGRKGKGIININLTVEKGAIGIKGL